MKTITRDKKGQSMRVSMHMGELCDERRTVKEEEEDPKKSKVGRGRRSTLQKNKLMGK